MLTSTNYSSRQEVIYQLWDSALSLEGIARELNPQNPITKQRIMVILNKMGLRSKYREERQRKKEELQNARINFVEVLRQITLERAEKELGWAYRKALEYDFARERIYKKSIALDRLVGIFKKYEDAKNSGELSSLRDMGEKYGFKPMGVSRILKRVGLEPLYDKKKIEFRVNQEKKEAINKAFDLDINAEGVGYFLGIHGYLINYHWRKIKRNKPKRHNLGFTKNGTCLTYDFLSQIYQAEELGFNPKEITELLDVDADYVESAHQVRKSVEPRIINLLRAIYPDNNINKPYLESKIA